MSRRDGAPTPVKPRQWASWGPSTAVLSQDEQRERRRQRLTVHYTGTFSLREEVAAVLPPLGTEVSRLPAPHALRREVDAVAEAVAEVVDVAARLIAESKTADGATRRLAADLAVRPRQPVITDEQIVSGSWTAAMVEYAGEVADALAAVLGRALPPDAEALRGSPSASERVERALRTLDRTARDLEHRIPGVRKKQSLPSMAEYNRQQRERRDQERAERLLARIGAPTMTIPTAFE